MMRIASVRRHASAGASAPSCQGVSGCPRCGGGDSASAMTREKRGAARATQHKETKAGGFQRRRPAPSAVMADVLCALLRCG
jgi:hypothetical protein